MSLHRFNSETPGVDARHWMEDIGRKEVCDLSDGDFRRIGAASAPELRVALESARQQVPPNLHMISYLAGVATANKGFAINVGGYEANGAASEFTGIAAAVLSSEFRIEPRA